MGIVLAFVTGALVVVLFLILSKLWPTSVWPDPLRFMLALVLSVGLVAADMALGLSVVGPAAETKFVAMYRAGDLPVIPSESRVSEKCVETSVLVLYRAQICTSAIGDDVEYSLRYFGTLFELFFGGDRWYAAHGSTIRLQPDGKACLVLRRSSERECKSI